MPYRSTVIFYITPFPLKSPLANWPVRATFLRFFKFSFREPQLRDDLCKQSAGISLWDIPAAAPSPPARSLCLLGTPQAPAKSAPLFCERALRHGFPLRAQPSRFSPPSGSGQRAKHALRISLVIAALADCPKQTSLLAGTALSSLPAKKRPTPAGCRHGFLSSVFRSLLPLFLLFRGGRS